MTWKRSRFTALQRLLKGALKGTHCLGARMHVSETQKDFYSYIADDSCDARTTLSSDRRQKWTDTQVCGLAERRIWNDEKAQWIGMQQKQQREGRQAAAKHKCRACILTGERYQNHKHTKSQGTQIQQGQYRGIARAYIYAYVDMPILSLTSIFPYLGIKVTKIIRP